MAAPMTADEFVSALKAEGVRVVEYRSWRTHNRAGHGDWGPVNGVVVHHTVSSGTDSTVAMCYDGYAGLPGPLCQGVIAKDGTVYLTGNGRCNHAGAGSPLVLDAVINESYGAAPPATHQHEGSAGAVDGNIHFYGFECVNMGDGKDPWPTAQLDAIERAAAAVCRHYGWSAKSVIGHLEWSDWKDDPRGFTMPAMRARVQARLTGRPVPVPSDAVTIKGTDVASYQGMTPLTSGTDFMIIKATEGTGYISPYQVSQARTARAAGLVTGFYHYLSTGPVTAQAAYFVDKCDSVAGDILACDWEAPGVGCAAKDAFLKEVKRLRPGHKVILYCNKDFWFNLDTTSYAGDGLWIADYDNAPGHPGIKAPWVVHQYSDSGGVDRNVAAFASRADMRTWATG